MQWWYMNFLILPLCLDDDSKFFHVSACFCLLYRVLFCPGLNQDFTIQPKVSLFPIAPFPKSRSVCCTTLCHFPQVLEHLSFWSLQPRLPWPSSARPSWFVKSRPSCASALTGPCSTCVKSFSVSLCSTAIKFEIKTCLLLC